MKLRKLVLVLIAVVAAIALIGCEKTNSSNPKISFNTYGGSQVETIEKEASSKITAPSNPIKAGFTFVGWYSDSSYQTKFQFTTMPANDITLYAKWQLQSFVINYEVGDGENSGENPSTYTVLQNDIILQAPTCEGYYFAGWYTDEAYNNRITSISTSSAMNYDLYAKWSEEVVVIDYNITYHLDGGTNGNNPEKFNSDDWAILLLPATKSGYTFKGWFADQDFLTQVSSIDTQAEHDYDLYAKWEKSEENPPVTPPTTPSYTISYVMNGGTNGNNPIRYTEEDGTITLKNPSKTSCTFRGWYTDEEFENPITEIDCSKKQNITLYAKWYNSVTVMTYEFDFGIGEDVLLYHVSDTHINAGTSDFDKSKEAEWIDNGRYGYANSFGIRYDKNNLLHSSTENFINIVNFLNEENPDVVCYTGDLMDYYSVASCNFIAEEIVKTNAPYIYALGNHESPFTNYTSMESTVFTTTSIRVLDMGAYEIVVLYNADTIDGVYYYTEEQYTALLAETQKNKPIIICQHVPLLTSYNCDTRLEDCGTYFYIDENSCDEVTANVMDLICNNANIKAVLCGHIHGNLVSEIAPGKPLISCAQSMLGTINKIILH